MDEIIEESVEEAIEVAGDEMSRLAISIFDQSHGVPVAAQTVIALRAFGFKPPEIARRLGYKDSSGVRKMLSRYDPNRVAEKGDAIRKLVLSCMLERVAFEALTTIRPEEIREADVKDKIAIVEKCVKAMRDLNPKTIPLERHEADLLRQLQGEEDE